MTWGWTFLLDNATFRLQLEFTVWTSPALMGKPIGLVTHRIRFAKRVTTTLEWLKQAAFNTKRTELNKTQKRLRYPNQNKRFM